MMTKNTETPNVAKTLEEAKDRLKKADKRKITFNTEKMIAKRAQEKR